MGMGGRHRAVLERYVHDMRRVVGETARVLADGGRAAYVVGENTVRGVNVRNSRMVERIANAEGLATVRKCSRDLPPGSRSLPPPATGQGTALGGRMRREVVLEFKKSRRL